jgi:hypothetical protein
VLSVTHAGTLKNIYICYCASERRKKVLGVRSRKEERKKKNYTFGEFGAKNGAWQQVFLIQFIFMFWFRNRLFWFRLIFLF